MLAVLVRFPRLGLPVLCSCVTNQTCASGCAIVLSAPKRVRKRARASRHRLLFNLLTTMLLTPRRLKQESLKRNPKARNPNPPNPKSKRGLGQRARQLTAIPPEFRINRNVRLRTTIPGGDGGGEEADEAEVVREDQSRVQLPVPRATARRKSARHRIAPRSIQLPPGSRHRPRRRERRRAPWFLPSDCRDRERAPGSNGTTSRRFRATCCGHFCLTIPPNNVFRT